MNVPATQQLTAFLAAVSAHSTVPAAYRAAVERAAQALAAEATVVLTGDEGFTTQEMTLVRGMARAVELCRSTLDLLEAERSRAEENARLVDSLRDRQRLLEQISAIQRAIARRAPLQQVLDTVTAGARELLDVGMAALSLLDSDDPTLASMVSSSGVTPDVRVRMRQVPLTATGLFGHTILGDELVHVEDRSDAPRAVPELAAVGLQAAMAVPVHDSGLVVGCLMVGSYAAGRAWDKPAQEALKAFAEQVSLAITDARTREAAHLGHHDSLTGLASRSLFMKRVDAALAGSDDPRSGVAALFVDLDRFKIVNDSLGHSVGDLLLVGVAERIRSCVRAGDLVARLGGDEFVVLLPNIRSLDEVTPVARRVLDALRRPFDLDGREAFVSSSIGIALGSAGEHDAEELMLRADLAMYRAKKQGKDRFEVFEPAMRAAYQEGLELEADLRRAIVKHEFVLRYQPIVHLRTGEIAGVEALVRWQHPQRGLVPPLDFIPIAEATGLIVPLGEWVLREACRQAAGWNARRRARDGQEPRPLTMSVNLSAVQLDQPDLPTVVADALRDAGLPPELLVLELTESLLVDHSAATAEQLRALKALGVRLAIDDFGTGYSSLAYLRRLPVDIIKIDKSFVDEVGDVPAASALTLGIVQLGQALQLCTVAEGIEHAQQRTELADGNCELGQGYFFAKPLDAADVAALLLGGDPVEPPRGPAAIFAP